MSTNNGAVQHPILHIWITRKVDKHSFPHAIVTPTSKPLVDTIPVSIFIWQQAPLRPTAAHPQNGLYETSALLWVPNIRIRIVFEKRPNLFPLVICQFWFCHISTLTSNPKMSTEPSDTFTPFHASHATLSTNGPPSRRISLVVTHWSATSRRRSPRVRRRSGHRPPLTAAVPAARMRRHNTFSTHRRRINRENARRRFGG